MTERRGRRDAIWKIGTSGRREDWEKGGQREEGGHGEDGGQRERKGLEEEGVLGVGSLGGEREFKAKYMGKRERGGWTRERKIWRQRI